MAGWSGLARRSARRTFRDRREAGQVLAQALTAYHGRDDLLILGLARGGVPVGWEVAAALRAPLDVFLVRKLGVPQWEELAMGALASGGGLVVNDNLMQQPGHQRRRRCATTIDRETEELNRREQAYRGGRARGGPEGQGRDHRRRRDRHRRKHARRGARGARRTAGKRGGRGSGRAAVGLQSTRPARPTTWCARRCRRRSKRSDRCTQTSTRSPTTKCANCWRSRRV